MVHSSHIVVRGLCCYLLFSDFANGATSASTSTATSTATSTEATIKPVDENREYFRHLIYSNIFSLSSQHVQNNAPKERDVDTGSNNDDDVRDDSTDDDDDLVGNITVPSVSPSISLSISASLSPSILPSSIITTAPSQVPTKEPFEKDRTVDDDDFRAQPSTFPSTLPSIHPSTHLSISPTTSIQGPSVSTSETPSWSPTNTLSLSPTRATSTSPSLSAPDDDNNSTFKEYKDITVLESIFLYEFEVKDDSIQRIYTLKPNTIFRIVEAIDIAGQPTDGGDYPLFLDNSNILVRCGADGHPDNNCRMQGGLTQFDIKGKVRESTPEYNYPTHGPLHNVVIQGITFEKNEMISNRVLAYGDVTFQHCIFADNKTPFNIYLEIQPLLPSFGANQPPSDKSLILQGEEKHPQLAAHEEDERHTDDDSRRLQDSELTVTFDGCIFSGSRLAATQSGPFIDAIIYNIDAKVIVTNSIFQDNRKPLNIMNLLGSLQLVGNCFMDDVVSIVPVLIEQSAIAGEITSNYVDVDLGWNNCDFIYFAKDGSCGNGGDLDKCPLLPANSTQPPTVTPSPSHIRDTRYDIHVDSVRQFDYSKDWTLDLTSAATRWEQIIVGDLPEVNGSLLEGLVTVCTELPPVIDDLYICAFDTEIDGLSGVLGMARPTMAHRDTMLPVAGEIFFDEKDIQRLLDDGSFSSVILHELGHVLGYGYFEMYGIGFNRGSSAAPNWEYTGEKACDKWASYPGCTGCPPIENDYGPGSAGAHWDEATMGQDLMSTALTGESYNPLSDISIAVLEDMGYDVDYSTADVLPNPCSRRHLRRERIRKRPSPKVEKIARKYGKQVLLEQRKNAPKNVPEDLIFIGDRAVNLIIQDEDSGEIFGFDISAADVGLDED